MAAQARILHSAGEKATLELKKDAACFLKPIAEAEHNKKNCMAICFPSHNVSK